MKKLIVICIIAAFATSCKKDYSCACSITITASGISHLIVDTYKGTTKKKDAEAWCKAFENSTLEVNGTPTPAKNGTCILIETTH